MRKLSAGTDFTPLLRRLVEATGPDRELDREIVHALKVEIATLPPLTADTMACQKICERVYPGFDWLVRSGVKNVPDEPDHDERPFANISGVHRGLSFTTPSYATTAPLAFCLALITTATYVEVFDKTGDV